MTAALHIAGLLQTKSYRILQAQVTGCLQTYGLNHSQWVMLGVAANAEGGIRLNRTADILGVKAPLITAMANELIDRGLMDRVVHRRDKRAKLLAATEKGKQLLDDVQKDVSSVLRQLLAGLSDDDLETYKKVLTTIIANSQNPIH